MNDIQIIRCPRKLPGGPCNGSVAPLEPNPPAAEGTRYWKCNACGLRMIIYEIKENIIS